MAYMSQEKKRELSPGIKAVCKKYGIKATIGVRNHSSLVLNVSKGPIDFISQVNKEEKERCERNGFSYHPSKSIQVNVYHLADTYSGKAHGFLKEVSAAMNGGNHDRSDIMADYFDVGWYTDINIGNWDKPYVLI